MAERKPAAANDSSDSDENPYRINIPNDDDEIRQNIMKKQQYEKMRMERTEQDDEYETALLQHKQNIRDNRYIPRDYGTSSNIINEAEELLKNINKKYNFKPTKPNTPATPATPAIPAIPVTPAKLAIPVTPAKLAIPVTPAKLAIPVTPARLADVSVSVESVSGDGPEDEEPLVPKSREDLRKARMQWLNKMSK